MKPVSNEKRELLVEAKERGEKDRDISKWLKISISTVTKIWKRHRETGSIEPEPYKGRPSCLTAEMIEGIRTKVKVQPDASLEEIIEDLDLPIKKSRLSAWLIQEGLSYKKKRFTQRIN